MPKDTFYEESAISAKRSTEKKIYAVLNIFSLIMLVCALIFVLFSVSYVSMQWASYQNGEMEKIAFIFSLLEWFLIMASFFAFFLLFYFAKRRYNVSYDYVFVEDELRVSKVFNEKKRKFMRKLEADHMLKIGYVKNDSFEQTCRTLSKKEIIFFSPNRDPSDGKEFYYILYSDSLGKRVYVIEAREHMLECLVLAAGMNKFERK